jgi:hypothetical protein
MSRLECRHILESVHTSAQNDADARRLAAISADSASLSPSGGATVGPPT